LDRREVAAVLAYIGHLDPRTIRTGTGDARDQIAQWHELEGDITLRPSGSHRDDASGE
jgi:hypothetical protein